MTQVAGVSAISRRMAAGDFGEIAQHFSAAVFNVRLPAPGILQIRSAGSIARPALLLSAGIHGDETAPIEILAGLLARLTVVPQALAVDLMVVTGNLAAIAAGQRYIDVDMNRLFGGDRSTMNPTAKEIARADLIAQQTAAFMSGITAPRWHLDLHTAIRDSNYLTFAIVPAVIAPEDRDSLIAWLGGAGIGAAIINPKPAGTYSAYTATQFGAVSSTVELGRVAELGKNDLTMLSATESALDALLRSGRLQPLASGKADVFVTAQELIKRSENFSLAFDRDTKNFTPMTRGTIIAQDGEVVYRVGEETEYVVFPNPDVRVGQRSGLMVVRRDTT
jgi:succinylglutamate desuccinylase